ncbi:MAG: hypothetical protein HY744_18020 [Deltaproteobacteria bacterium]|nr:hypothetical protein [Deltaproteobacteria bacterium]
MSKKLLHNMVLLALGAGFVGVATLAAAGCELIASVDRSKIDAGATTTATGGGGAGGTTVTTGGGGQGGGGAPACVPEECPGVDTDCAKRTCVAGACETANAEKDTGCKGAGDAKFCDGEGNCVECNDGKQCDAQICDKNKCVPASCADKVQNGEESDVDCGGSDCAPCDNDKKCNEAIDCDSGFCDTGGGGSGGSAGGICTACVEHDDCAESKDTYCEAGECVAQKAKGEACDGAVKCLSGNCVDEVCCDKACAGSCDVCSKKLGASDNGVCTPLAKDTECRASAGECDVAERCDGSAGDCPADGFKDTECRAAVAGGCDVAEACDGVKATCPPRRATA